MNSKRKLLKKPRISIKKDTPIGLIEKALGINLGVKPDMKASSFLRLKGYPSLARMLEA